MEDAASTPIAEKTAQTLKMVPSFPSSRLNLRLKKYMIQALVLHQQRAPWIDITMILL